MTNARVLLWSLAVLAGGAAAGGVFLHFKGAGDDTNLRFVAANPAAGFRWPYYLYAPEGAKRILVRPNNTSGGGHDDFEVHRKDAHKKIRHERKLAAELGCAVLMPVFPRPRTEWRVYTHALDRDSIVTEVEGLARPDLQLIAMIDDAKKYLRSRGVTPEEKVFISGFSADGMFANRFTLLHPHLIQAAAIGSPGGWPMVPAVQVDAQHLRYPIGVADFRDLFQREFDAEAARRVPMFFYLGTRDTNDSVPYEDSYDPDDARVIMETFGKTPIDRWDRAEALYRREGFAAAFRKYEGVEHEITPEMEKDVLTFLSAYAR